jgi:hypothetical protein
MFPDEDEQKIFEDKFKGSLDKLENFQKNWDQIKKTNSFEVSTNQSLLADYLMKT